MEKLNTWGGSVSIGHPFGATGGLGSGLELVNMCTMEDMSNILAGIRLLSHAAHRLEAEDGERWV